MTVIQLAAQMADSFVRQTRDNGDDFYCLKDDAPEWMSNAARAAHVDMMPDDWRYLFIVEACRAIADCDESDLENAIHEYSDDVDVMNAVLLEWVGSNLSRMAYVDDAISNGADTLARALMEGQAAERQETWDALVDALEELNR